VPLDDWSRDEVEATVADYFEMLSEELAGRPVNKAVEDTPPEDMKIPNTVWTPHARLARVDFVARDAANRDLGRRGEDSFNGDGSRRVIEVKTTGLGKYFPFNVTVNEVRCSEALPDEFQLYRVFNLGRDARLYPLKGPLSRSCHLDPAQYRAFVGQTIE